MKYKLIAAIIINGEIVQTPQYNELIGFDEYKKHLITIHAEIKALLNYYRKVSYLYLNRGGIVFDPRKIDRYP